MAALIARALCEGGHRVGVYKPAASGCRLVRGGLVSDDAVALWEAAGRPGRFEWVCPQCFEAPLAPHLAAIREGRRIDEALLAGGLDRWRSCSDVILVEGSGGLMSPLGKDRYVVDLAYQFGFHLIVVAQNALGTINQTLQTLIAAATFRGGLRIAGVVLNNPARRPDDQSTATNRQELAAHCIPPLLAEVAFGADRFDEEVDWFGLAD